MTNQPQLLADLYETLRCEAGAAAPAAPAGNPRGRDALVRFQQACEIFKAQFGGACTDLLAGSYHMHEWTPSLASIRQAHPGAPVGLEAETRFVGTLDVAETALQLLDCEGRRLVLRISAGGQRPRAMLLEHDWAPRVSRLPEPEGPGAWSEHLTIADHLRGLAEVITEVEDAAASDREIYASAMQLLEGGLADSLLCDLVPAVLQRTPESELSSMIGTAQSFAVGQLETGQFKNPVLATFLRDLIQQPHGLSAVQIKPLASQWVLVRHPEDRALETQVDILTASTRPAPVALPPAMQPGPAVQVRLPLGAIGFQLDPRQAQAQAHGLVTLLELGAALKGLLLEQ